MGELLGKYRKLHLFDVDIPNGITFKESDVLSKGTDILAFDLKFGLSKDGCSFDHLTHEHDCHWSGTVSTSNVHPKKPSTPANGSSGSEALHGLLLSSDGDPAFASCKPELPNKSCSSSCRVGIGICYDLRFEELAKLYRLLDCDILVYPAAFNLITGPLHFELLQVRKIRERPKDFSGKTRKRMNFPSDSLT